MEDEPGATPGSLVEPIDQSKAGSDEEYMAEDPETPLVPGPSPASPAVEGSPETPQPQTSGLNSDQAPRTVLHHLTRHWLPEDERGGEAMLHRFGAPSLEAARHAVRGMGQRELRAAFQRVYGTPTHSYNNSWLRRKLFEALGLTTASQGRGGAGGRPGRPRRGDRRRGMGRGRGTYAPQRPSPVLAVGEALEEDGAEGGGDESSPSPNAAGGGEGVLTTPPMPTRRHHTRAASAVDAEAAAQSALNTIAGAIDLISPFVSPIQSPQRGLSFRGTMPMPGPNEASPPDLARAARLYQQEAAAAAARQQFYIQQQQYQVEQQYQALAADAGEQAGPRGEPNAGSERGMMYIAGWPTGSPPDTQPQAQGHPWGLLPLRAREPASSIDAGHADAGFQPYDRSPPGYDPYLAAPAPARPHQQSMFAPPLDPEQARLYQQLVTRGIGATLNASGHEPSPQDVDAARAEALHARHFAVAQQLQYQDRGWGPPPTKPETSARRASSTPP